jgi:CBS domain-containing protein
VKKYLGMCLFAQGGVAIGLSILAGHRFDTEISSIVILVVACTTFVVQLAGPVFVKHAVKKAGEVNMNITEQDLIDTYKVADVIDRDRVTIKGNTTLDEIITTFGKTRFTYYPVIDDNEKLIGVITIEGIRSTLADTKASSWLLAMDIMSPVLYSATPDMPLAEVLKKAGDINLDHIPVTRSKDDKYCMGILDLRLVKRALGAEVLSRQQKADIIQTA